MEGSMIQVKDADRVDLPVTRRDDAGRLGFWRRQFASPPTRRQLAFDVAAGIVLPIICLAFDPVVFRGGAPGPLLGGYRAFSYVAIGFGVSALALWLWLKRWTAPLSGVIGGALAAGALFSFGVGVVILPLSLIGLFLLIGALGFSPFLTSFVFLRNALRALAHARLRVTTAQLVVLALLGAAVAIGGPSAAQWKISQMMSRSIQEIVGGGEAPVRLSIVTLRLLAVVGDTDEIVWAYEREADPRRKERLAKAYREITGTDIEDRLMILLD